MHQVEELRRYAERLIKDAENGEVFGIIVLEKRRDGEFVLAERGSMSMRDRQVRDVMREVIQEGDVLAILNRYFHGGEE